MRLSLSRLSNSLPFFGLLRKFEQEMEVVIKVLQPGPLGIIEHKFSAEEIRQANATVEMAVQNWRRNAKVEKQDHPILSSGGSKEKMESLMKVLMSLNGC